MTVIGPGQWLVALILSLFAHLALGFWLDQLPPTPDKITVKGLTVFLAVATTADSGGRHNRAANAAKNPTTKQSQAAPRPERATPKPAAPEPTLPSTNQKPVIESRARAAIVARENPAPKPPATPKPKPVKRALQSLKSKTSARRLTELTATGATTAATQHSAVAPRPTATSHLPERDGDVTGAGAELSAAAPVPGNPKPRYPSLARRRGYEGRVLIQVAIRADGRAAQVEVKQSSGHRVLDKAALAAVKDWHFRPARRAGRPVTATVDVPISFRLDDDSSF